MLINIKPLFVKLIEEFLSQVSLLQNESVEKNKSIQSLHNQICSFEIEIERQKEMLRNNESKILHLQVSILPGGRQALLTEFLADKPLASLACVKTQGQLGSA